jgi:hypothetical protein
VYVRSGENRASRMSWDFAGRESVNSIGGSRRIADFNLLQPNSNSYP